MRHILPATKTTLDPRATAVALATEFAAQGHPLSLPAVELLTVQIWIETGGHVTANNFGNEMAAMFVAGHEVSVWHGDAWRPNWFEPPTDATTAATRALHDRMLATPATVPSAFRVYDTEAEGLAGHVRTLRENFPHLVDAASTGDVHAFRLAVITPDPATKRLYSPDYGPASETTMTELRDKFRAANVFDGLGNLPKPPMSGAATAVALVLLALAGLLARRFT